MHLVLAVSDVERAYAFYRDALRAVGDEAAYFSDPDGNVVAVAARLAEQP
jgi:catechol-2,3-dioxygenase